MGVTTSEYIIYGEHPLPHKTFKTKLRHWHGDSVDANPDDEEYVKLPSQRVRSVIEFNESTDFPRSIIAACVYRFNLL